MTKISKLKKAVLPIAFLLFIAGIFVALRNQPEGFGSLEWTPLIVIGLILTPLTFTFLAFELITVGTILGKTLKVSGAIKAVILSTAMNIFPVPGGYLVRYAYLRTEGVRRRDAVILLVIQNMVWVGASLVMFATICIFYRPEFVAEGMVMGGGGMAIVAAIFIVLYKLHNKVKAVIHLVIIRLVLVCIDCARIYLCFIAMNSGVGFFESMIIGLSRVISGVIFFIPGGVGVNEAISELLGGMLGIQPGVAYLASSLDRLAIWVFLAVAVAIILLTDRKRVVGRK